MTSTFGPPVKDAQDQASRATTPFMNGKKPLNILIIGGSCAGLFIAILLKRQGHNTTILESAISSEREGLAAGIGLAAHVKRFFDTHDRLHDVPFGSPNDFLHVVEYGDGNGDGDGVGKAKGEIPMHFRMTTWDAAYYRLRANFDAFQSSYCEEPPGLDPGEGEGVFKTGKRALSVRELEAEATDDADGTGVEVTVEDVVTHTHSVSTADIVIAADGANSRLRAHLLPDLPPREEPGYVIWRGTVPTASCSQHLLDRLQGHTTLYHMPAHHSYAIIYTIPGANGTLDPEQQAMNFAWYHWPPGGRAEIADILTDTEGHQHRTTLPKGKMRPAIWQKQLQRAEEIMSPLLFSLVAGIQEPFVSVVSSHASPRAAFMHDRVFLIGDALAQIQPNTGQGTNFAALDAMLLAEVFEGKRSVAEWEEEVLGLARRERIRAVSFASWWLCGWWGLGVNWVRWKGTCWWLDFRGRWWRGRVRTL